MSGGGRAFGEMMMRGATVGSCGLRDQMAQMGWVDSCAVDIESMWEYDEDVGRGVCRGGGVSDSVGGSWGAMGTGMDSCFGNGDLGCCQDGKNGSVGGWVVV